MADLIRTNQTINSKEIRVVGMSRSGNHAIINWILRQSPGRTCFLNCVEPKTNPFATARPLGDKRGVVVNYRGFDLEAEAEGDLSAKDLLLYSYEDVFLGMVASPLFRKYHDEWIGGSAETLDVLILRDPFNLFASRFRSGLYRHGHGEPPSVTNRTAIRIWKQHAREFAGIRTYLDRPKVAISFNQWASDSGYRHLIARQLGLDFTDAGVDDVAATAGGSSFDGTRYDGKAGEMDVFGRWRHYAGESDLWRHFDDEVHELSDGIFGHLPGKSRLRVPQRRAG